MRLFIARSFDSTVPRSPAVFMVAIPSGNKTPIGTICHESGLTGAMIQG